MTTRCGGCIKVRRAIIHKAPATLAKPLARAFLPTVTDASAVVAEARTWVGVPFRHQGRDRRGVDCLGLPVVVLSALGALPPDLPAVNYPRTPQQNDLERGLLRYCTRLPAVVPGALIAIKWQKAIAHLAIYTDTDTLIHAYERQGRTSGVIEHGFRGMWRERLFAGAWALPGVRYG